MMKIEGNEKTTAQNRFIANLDKNLDNKNMIVSKVNLLLANEGVGITKDQLPSLLK